MSDLEQAIHAFEKEYLRKLQNYSALVQPEDLDALLTFIDEVQARSEALTARFRAADADLFEQRWRPIIARMQTLVPAVTAHMERLKIGARSEAGHLGKGQKGLRGYRQTLPVRNTFFDSEG